jgi:hypothetical protein
MAQPVRILAAVVVLIAAGVRLWTFADPALRPLDDLRPIRELVLADQEKMTSKWIDDSNRVRKQHSSNLIEMTQRVADAGVREIVFERFDPDAVVLMRSGPDMQPGVAAVDDNANGIVDDASELGATGSDDVCLVQRASPDPSDDEITLVLQHGAFVPALPSELKNRSSQWRARVKGQSNGDHWSLLVEME